MRMVKQLHRFFGVPKFSMPKKNIILWSVSLGQFRLQKGSTFCSARSTYSTFEKVRQPLPMERSCSLAKFSYGFSVGKEKTNTAGNHLESRLYIVELQFDSCMMSTCSTFCKVLLVVIIHIG